MKTPGFLSIPESSASQGEGVTCELRGTQKLPRNRPRRNVRSKFLILPPVQFARRVTEAVSPTGTARQLIQPDSP
jgi:hypothetical protein